MKLITLKKLTFGLSAALAIGAASGASAESLRVGMECTYPHSTTKLLMGNWLAMTSMLPTASPVLSARSLNLFARNGTE